MKKIFWIIFSFLLFIPQKAKAFFPEEWTDKVQNGDFTLNDIIDLILYIIQSLIELGGILAVIMVMVGGYYYIIGAITDDKDKAKNIIKYAIIGFALAVFSWLIVELIIRFLIS